MIDLGFKGNSAWARHAKVTAYHEAWLDQPKRECVSTPDGCCKLAPRLTAAAPLTAASTLAIDMLQSPILSVRWPGAALL